MKLTQKIVILTLACFVIIGLAVSCEKKGGSAAGGAFPGKIAVVTNTVSQNEEEFRSAEALVKKYGKKKVVFVTWPDNFMAEQEQMVTTVARLAADKDIKALVINQAVPGSNAAVDKLLETRDDIFIAYCQPQENPPDVSQRANLIINYNELEQGIPMVDQSVKMGAKVFVHYSFPRHMSIVMLAARRDQIRDYCNEIGIQYVDATAPDPTGDSGVPGAQLFILEDVPKMVDKYGKDTAFFSTNCAMQTPLIKAVVENGAIYPQPCCPSPFHGFPSALAVKAKGLDIKYMVAETRKALAAKNELGRLSTWPIPGAMLFTSACAEYAIKWIKGEVPKEGIDEAALAECMNEYIYEVSGEKIPVSMVDYNEDGETFSNFKLVLVDYLTY